MTSADGDQLSSLADDLRQEYTIETPESVSFRYEIAGIGSRFIGALIDLTAVVILLVVLNVVALSLILAAGGEAIFFGGFESDLGWLPGFVLAFYVLLEFAIIWGYFMLFELLWDGKTPGKRAAGTRVVRLDGEPAGFGETAIRNLVRIVDFMPTLYAIGFITMLFNDKSRRLGDFAAGTIVVREQTALGLADLCHTAPRVEARAEPAPKIDSPSGAMEASRPAEVSDAQDFSVAPNVNLRRMSHDDYALIRDALDREGQGRLPFSTLARLAAFYAAKLDAPLPPPDREGTRAYLSSLAQAWEGRTGQ